MAQPHRRDFYLQVYSHWPPRTLDDRDTRENWIADSSQSVQPTRTYRPMRFSFERSMPGKGPTSYAYRYEQEWIRRSQGNNE